MNTLDIYFLAPLFGVCLCPSPKWNLSFQGGSLQKRFPFWLQKCFLPTLRKGFPGGSEIENVPALQETQVHSWVRKIRCRRDRLPTPIVLPGKSHGQRSLLSYSPWGCKESGVTEALSSSSTLIKKGQRLMTTTLTSLGATAASCSSLASGLLYIWSIYKIFLQLSSFYLAVCFQLGLWLINTLSTSLWNLLS